ncbi:MAG: hypothetical protein MUF50_01655 [Planctomycetes bacterium]|jgi:hypothetical protein|nr:hypothetical protein [Planctomycetota bacterium]
MPLSIHLLIHFLFAVVAGWFIFKLWGVKWWSLLGGILGGFFIDLDHVLEYFLVFGWRFSFTKFFNGEQFVSTGVTHLYFHGWEYLVVLFLIILIIKNKKLKSFLAALALGAFFHLICDVFINVMPVEVYSIIYRASKAFIFKQMVPDGQMVELGD